MNDNGAALWKVIQGGQGSPSSRKFECTHTGPDNGRDELDASLGLYFRADGRGPMFS